MSKWVKWFASYLFTSAKDPQQFSENLALSLATVDPTDVWCLIESEEDEKFSLQSQKERQARETELQQMKGFMARSPSQQDWLKKFAELLLTVPSDDQHIVLSSLPSDMRVSIINRIVKTRYLLFKTSLATSRSGLLTNCPILFLAPYISSPRIPIIF